MAEGEYMDTSKAGQPPPYSYGTYDQTGGGVPNPNPNPGYSHQYSVTSIVTRDPQLAVDMLIANAADAGPPVPGEPSPTYKCFAVFICFLCLPFGIHAVIYSRRTKEENALGNWQTAKVCSNQTLKYCKLGVLFGVIFIVFILVGMIMII